MDCQAAIFLVCFGADAYEIFSTMEFDDEADKADPDKPIDAFEKHCIAEVNEVYESYAFQRRQQEPGENFNVFLSDLVKSIRNRIVLEIHDDGTRKKLLQTRKLDLS